MDAVVPAVPAVVPAVTVPAGAVPVDFFFTHIAGFWIIFIAFILIPWIFLVVKWLRNDPVFMDLGSAGKVLQLDSYRRIQDERDREEELEKLGGFLTAAAYKEKTAIDLDPLKDKASTGQLAYWYYMDMVNNEIGPLTSEEMRERWLEGNYHMHKGTQVREAWWPEDQHYGVGEIFPDMNDEDIFVAPPVLPGAVVEIIEEGIQTGSNLPSRSATKPSVAVLRTSKQISNKSMRKSSKAGTRLLDDILDEVEIEV